MADQTSSRVSRVLPGLTTAYTIVSMPAWAWPWLDTLVNEHFPQGYGAFIRECASHADENRPLADILETFARLRREDHYRLTNDNLPQDDRALPTRLHRKPAACRAKAVKLFSFLPHATDWESVLIRKGWSPSSRSSY